MVGLTQNALTSGGDLSSPLLAIAPADTTTIMASTLTTHVRWSFMLTPRSVSGWLASTMLVYVGCSSPDASSASELPTHVPAMSTQETHPPDIEAPRPALDVQSFDCQDVPDLALAEQRTLLARWFADWDIRPPTKADGVWELDGKDTQAVVAHGLGKQAPAWLTAGSDFEPSTARVLGRHRVGHHWVTVVSVQHPAMSGGHPGGATLVGAVDQGTPNVLGNVGEWDQCKGAVRLFQRFDDRIEVVLVSFSSAQGSEFVAFDLRAWSWATHTVFGIPHLMKPRMRDDCGAREPCTRLEVDITPSRTEQGYDVWIHERGDEVHDGRAERVDRRRRVGSVRAATHP
ncbi:MAG: hypothetical protein R3B72_24250 [Polyangiaceae bacterium]